MERLALMSRRYAPFVRGSVTLYVMFEAAREVLAADRPGG